MKRSRGNKIIKISWISRKGSKFPFPLLLHNHKSKFKLCLQILLSNISNRLNTSPPFQLQPNPNIKTILHSTPQPTLRSSRQPVALTFWVSTSSNAMRIKRHDRGSTENSWTPRRPPVKPTLQHSQVPVKKTLATRYSLRSSINLRLMSVPMGSCSINSSRCNSKSMRSSSRTMDSSNNSSS
jgi:hypothetical protein